MLDACGDFSRLATVGGGFLQAQKKPIGDSDRTGFNFLIKEFSLCQQDQKS